MREPLRTWLVLQVESSTEAMDSNQLLWSQPVRCYIGKQKQIEVKLLWSQPVHGCYWQKQIEAEMDSNQVPGQPNLRLPVVGVVREPESKGTPGGFQSVFDPF